MRCDFNTELFFMDYLKLKLYLLSTNFKHIDIKVFEILCVIVFFYTFYILWFSQCAFLGVQNVVFNDRVKVASHRKY